MITALVVMYNAEKILDDHFQSLWFCDEIIAIDIGSSDGSVDVAKRHNCKVVYHPWVPMGELAWSKYVANTSNDWIIISDPDEVVSSNLANEIIDAITTQNVGVISIPYRHFFKKNKINASLWKQVWHIDKVFHKERVNILCEVHRPFSIKPGYDKLKIESKFDESNIVYHYPATDIIFLLKKLYRYGIMEGESRFKRGERFTFYKFIKIIAGSIWINLKNIDSIPAMNGLFMGLLFILYDALAYLSLWNYQRLHLMDERVEILQIEPTRRCNMSCKHCNRQNDTSYISKEVFENILMLYPNVDIIKLQGLGEPLMHPSINTLIQRAHEHGSNVMVITNGSLPIPSGIDILIISLETMDPLKYKNLRGYDLCRVLENIKYAALNQKIIINCVQTHLTTSQDVQDVAKFARSINGEIWITPMEVWYDPLHQCYENSLNDALMAHEIHQNSCNPRKDDCRWLKGKYIYYDYAGRLHPCCIRMTDEYIIDDIETYDFKKCCVRCPL